jgi:hypothetical protein
LEIAGDVAHAVIIVLYAVSISLNLGAWFRWNDPDLAERYDEVASLPLGIAWLAMGMWDAYQRKWVQVALDAALAGYMLRNWWNRRGQKRAAKLAAMVRDLGHRLVVAPVTGGAR